MPVENALPTEELLLPLRVLDMLPVLFNAVPPTDAPATASKEAAPIDEGESIGEVLVDERDSSPLVRLEPELWVLERTVGLMS